MIPTLRNSRTTMGRPTSGLALPPIDAGSDPVRSWSPERKGTRIAPKWILGAGAVLVLAVGALGTGYHYEAIPDGVAPLPPAAKHVPAEQLKGKISELEKQLRPVRAKLANHLPRDRYIVIDRTNNRIQLRTPDTVERVALCSAGSGRVLKGGTRQWTFVTPPGKFKVLRKIENPVWKKPDWAFVEEGKPLPKDPGERFEYGVLGEYALYFGDGYMIHGTLYERLLGRSVSHGCIRVGRDDLRAIYAAAGVGTPIFIY